jgi:HEAT repeat protein
MMAWFCPRCHAEVRASDVRCSACGAGLGPIDYEDGLIAALDHRLLERRIIAAYVLGQRRSRRAIPRLIEVARDGSDPYLAAESVRALARIGGEEAEAVVRELATSGGAVVSSAARVSLGAIGTDERGPS